MFKLIFFSVLLLLMIIPISASFADKHPNEECMKKIEENIDASNLDALEFDELKEIALNYDGFKEMTKSKDFEYRSGIGTTHSYDIENCIGNIMHHTVSFDLDKNTENHKILHVEIDPNFSIMGISVVNPSDIENIEYYENEEYDHIYHGGNPIFYDTLENNMNSDQLGPIIILIVGIIGAVFIIAIILKFKKSKK